MRKRKPKALSPREAAKKRTLEWLRELLANGERALPSDSKQPDTVKERGDHDHGPEHLSEGP